MKKEPECCSKACLQDAKAAASPAYLPVLSRRERRRHDGHQECHFDPLPARSRWKIRPRISKAPGAGTFFGSEHQIVFPVEGTHLVALLRHLQDAPLRWTEPVARVSFAL
jgi:hypothetical protein